MGTPGERKREEITDKGTTQFSKIPKICLGEKPENEPKRKVQKKNEKIPRKKWKELRNFYEAQQLERES